MTKNKDDQKRRRPKTKMTINKRRPKMKMTKLNILEKSTSTHSSVKTPVKTNTYLHTFEDQNILKCR